METLSSIFKFFKKEVTSFLRNIFAVLQNFMVGNAIKFKQKASFNKVIARKGRVAIFAFLLALGVGGNAWGQCSQIWNSTGLYSWTCPAGVTSITVECWGGGGGGYSPEGNARGGQGGGGGAYSRKVITVAPGTAYSISVGTFGYQDSWSGTVNGGDSWFGSNTTVMAKGGFTGNGTSTLVGNGGAAASSVGSFTYSGGNSATCTSSSAATRGGAGGGSSAGTAANGLTGAANSTVTGGAGGTAPSGGGSGGSGGSSIDGSDGISPGGGGGGGANGFNGGYFYGGLGAAGQVKITLPISAPSNDACSAATALTIDAAATSASFACATSSGGSYSPTKPDVWFKFTTSCAGAYTITSTLSSYDADFYIYSSCSSTSDIASGNLASASLNETYTLTGLSASTTYYIRASDFKQAYSSFSIRVTGPSCSPTLTLSNPTTAVAAASICASSTAVPIHAFNITGSNAGGTLTNFSFTTTGTYLSADITNFKLLYNTTNTTVVATTLATSTTPGDPGVKTFTAFTQAIGNATGYFWITMDVAAGATDGRTITVSASAASGADMTTTATKAGTAAASGTKTLKVIPATPTISGTASFCSGGSTTLTSSANAGNQWYKDGVSISGATGTTLSVTTAGTYTVISTVSSCASTTSAGTAVTVNSTYTTYYSKSTGNLDLTSSWSSTTDGTGCSPANFTTAGVTYIIQQNLTLNATRTIGANWTVSGGSGSTLSTVVLGQASSAAVTFTVPNNYTYTGTIDVAAASSGSNTLVLYHTTVPTLGTLNIGSTVKFNASGIQTIPVNTYGNLETGVQSGSTNYTKTAAGILDINGNLTLGDYSTLALSSYSHTLAGDFIKPTGNGILNAGTSTLTFDGASTQKIHVTTAGGTTPCDADVTYNNLVINGTDVKLYYNQVTNRKMNIVDLTVNTFKVLTLFSAP